MVRFIESHGIYRADFAFLKSIPYSFLFHILFKREILSNLVMHIREWFIYASFLIKTIF